MKNRKRGKVRRKASPILILSILIDPDAPLLEWSAAFVGGRVTRATDIDHLWQWHMFRTAFRLGSTVIGNDFRHRYTLPKYFYPTPTETEYLEIWTFLTLYLLFLLFHYEKSWIENYTLLLYIQYFQLFLWIKDRFQRGNYEVELNRELEGRGIFSRSEFYRFITQWTIYSTFIHGMRQISKRVYSCR